VTQLLVRAVEEAIIDLAEMCTSGIAIQPLWAWKDQTLVLDFKRILKIRFEKVIKDILDARRTDTLAPDEG
jgi:hypothetical protein